MDLTEYTTPFRGKSATGLVSALVDGKPSDQQIGCLGHFLMLAVKDALMIVDDVDNPAVANAHAAQNAKARAMALLATIQMEGERNAVQEQEAGSEVSRATGPREDSAGSGSGVGQSEPGPKATRPRGRPRTKSA